jgi:translation initiation factor IF-2
MTDNEPSGADAAPAAPSVAPAGAAETPAQSAATAETSAFGSFGAKRGSGLARGKRSSTPAPSAAAAPANGAYQPTAVEVITPPREYKNPFGVETPTPVAAPAAVAEIEPESAPEALAPSAEPAPAASAPVEPPPAPVSEPRAEINVLPPAETKRVAVSWEHVAPAADQPVEPEHPYRNDRRSERREPRRDERPYFRTDGREGERFAEDRRPAGESRPEAVRPVEPAKPRGLLAWIKGLFGGAPKVEAPPPAPQGRPDFGPEGSDGNSGQRRRRRHRGGRGRNGDFRDGDRPSRDNNRADAPGAPGGEAPGEPRRDEQRGEYGGPRRRRDRGGRGRDRGRGDRGPRPEGQQGGGVI